MGDFNLEKWVFFGFTQATILLFVVGCSFPSATLPSATLGSYSSATFAQTAPYLQQYCVSCHLANSSNKPFADSSGNVSYQLMMASGYVQGGNTQSPLCQVATQGESSTSSVHSVINEDVPTAAADTICSWIQSGAMDD